MKPTHVLKTTDGGRYLLVDLTFEDHQTISKAIQSQNGIIRIEHVVEDPNWQSEKRYIQKVAILACRHIVSLEDV